jgi:hypothetical protein
VLWLSSTDLWACWAPTWERLLDCVFPCFLSPLSWLPAIETLVNLARLHSKSYVKRQAKLIMNQTYVDHEAYEGEGFLSLVLNSGRGLTPISRHNLPPIPPLSSRRNIPPNFLKKEIHGYNVPSTYTYNFFPSALRIFKESSISVFLIFQNLRTTALKVIPHPPPKKNLKESLVVFARGLEFFWSCYSNFFLKISELWRYIKTSYFNFDNNGL